jgi:formamidopyrimidine-DNA glycosylase
MPELPEVETVRRGLEPALVGKRLSKVAIRRPDLRFAFPPRFARRLAGARILELRRRGKFLIADLDSKESLIVHLGMTGRFLIEGTLNLDRRQPAPLAKHAHVVFETDDARIVFEDARRFGFMDLTPTAGLPDHPRLASLGPEPFDDIFAEPYLAEAFAGRRQGVKTVLLDQALVAGLGNIYASEALHRARIAPEKPAGAIGRPARSRLGPAVRAVLEEAIAAGGSTLRDFAAVNGSPGYFQHSFRVYGRGGEPCGSRGCRGRIRRTVQSGRSTYHCPLCQR